MYKGYVPLNLALVSLLIALCSAVGPPKQVGEYQARQIAKVGQTKKRFACPVEADPVPIVQWLKDGDTITEMWPRYRITKKEGALRIKDIELDDAGIFVCKATNGFGSINVNFSLVVVDKETGLVKQGGSVYEPGPDEDLTKEGGQMKTKPVLIGPHPLNETVTLGGYASFQCKVKSQVKPHIQWLKRLDKELEATVNSTNIIEVKGQKFVVLKTGEVYKDNGGFYVNKLVIKNVLGSDVGMYICLGANTMGYSFRSAFLTIVSESLDNPMAINPASAIKPGLQGIPSGTAQGSGSEGTSEEEVGNGSLPLIIAIPACVAIVLVTLAIFILKRRKKCNNNSNARRNTRFNAVPTQERENFPPAAQYPHILPPKGPPNRSMDKASTKHSSDFYSDISSVSRCHHHPQQGHSNHQYGY
ncbi:fibroblast growth factor receptor-like 1 isoform X2 [Ruditapes philippinarum]|uniref:fibroblast growth factor receptor-like 1 isoform X2 n=1 Tax=Ruditapes philippinarum TaxID=129788 RepID=UPI00295B96DB|nr:fibroblast growth factor receptor-like 1 isoform X2 [Ruditapes philippinarum]